MGKILDVIKSLVDMKELSKFQDQITAEVDALEKEGKLPADLKTAYEKLKSAAATKTSGESGGTGNVAATVEPLKEFAAELEKHEDLFSDNIKKLIGKYENVTEDLEGIAERIDSLNK